MRIKGNVKWSEGQQALLQLEQNAPIAGTAVFLSGGKDRSGGQNRLYWEMLTIVSNETGHSKDELHEFFKQEFLGDMVEVMDKPFVFSRSTTKLKTGEFTKYLTDIRYYVMDKLGFDLPIE